MAHIEILDGPLSGCAADLDYRPLDGEVHLFSDKPIDNRPVAYPYEFSEFRQGFFFVGDKQKGSEA